MNYSYITLGISLVSLAISWSVLIIVITRAETKAIVKQEIDKYRWEQTHKLFEEDNEHNQENR